MPDPEEPDVVSATDLETPPGLEPPPTAVRDLLAPDRRFVSARRNLGSFAKTGDAARLRRGIAQYVRTGYGGAGTMSRRLGSVSRTARSLSQVLDPGAADRGLDRALLQGNSVAEITDAVVEAACSSDGTLDAEASRESIRNALSDLLGLYSDVDLLRLTDAQREFVIESFVAHDVYRRFALDVGKHLVDNAPTATIGLSRLKQARNYIRQTIAESFRLLREAGQSMTTAHVRSTVANALTNSLVVFEGYLA
ncbi:Qat anti-phage system associated protein QatB [Microlunatus sp. Gsoil 973]|uniref:Qat anti-phage system associated protein QatB n=1 Tax=Microlunatus sp. Gsoil 973 TaxID=2672569 RepID=UPI001E54AC46|nr:Qat anti-phage system associated protein QatB [Microlunatus sp. Gsoil 973]